MKLFGKRKAKAALVTQPEEESPNDKQDEEVKSYFSSDFNASSSSPSVKKSRSGETKKDGGQDIKDLLKMDPSDLNAKQRRILRRHKERNEAGENVAVKNSTQAKTEASTSPKDTSPGEALKETQGEPLTAEGRNNEEAIESKEIEPVNLSSEKKSTSTISESSSTTEHTNTHSAEGIANQLKAMNSKERRKFLRRLASEAEGDESLKAELKQAITLSKQIAEENESKQIGKDSKKKNQTVQEKDDSAIASPSDSDIKHADGTVAKPTKKRKWKDFSHLPPEERERREIQRRMQQEAAARRASGEEVLTRHPLNSERRRANRRKPGRAGKIAALKKAQKAKQGTLRMFNASGYNMRHAKKSTTLS
eukprot:CAMPEP_0204618152 /NCGR_PEP_ID=MMETSP0717-20131115/4895_1 /ASSEMBLY_ACC=CAM_ASM_000666 /TAXON_ID=230516 /ORGANISM="Chaetoceros curvisetus" /LENGTH=364 /DNA_ID=CAMNT_0051631833 /DNA_START=35 /DNA_END=1129 /DNA_ORIENTATION=+